MKTSYCRLEPKVNNYHNDGTGRYNTWLFSKKEIHILVHLMVDNWMVT